VHLSPSLNHSALNICLQLTSSKRVDLAKSLIIVAFRAFINPQRLLYSSTIQGSRESNSIDSETTMKMIIMNSERIMKSCLLELDCVGCKRCEFAINHPKSSKISFLFLSSLPNTSSFQSLKSTFKALSLRAKIGICFGSNEKRFLDLLTVGSVSKPKGWSEQQNLECSINFDVRGNDSSRGKGKASLWV